MTKVYSLHDIPKSRLHVSYQVAESQLPFGEVLVRTKETLARQLSHTILEKDGAFSVTQPAKGYFQVDADVVVLTSNEFRQLMQEQFKKGVDHAQGFMPPSMDFIGGKQ